MKRILLFLLALLLLPCHANEELMLQKAYNNLEKLVYGIYVEPEFTEGKKIVAQIAPALKKQGIEIAVCDDERLADLRVVQGGDGQWCAETADMTEAFASPAALKKGLPTFIKKRWGQGMRPRLAELFESGKKGYAVYRIPSVVALPQGRLIAFVETRQNSRSDSEENDIVYRISKDGGKSWAPQKVLFENGAWSANNPTALYLPEQGRVLVLFQCYPPKTHEGANLRSGEKRQRVYMMQSDDGGESWGTPSEIGEKLFHPEANTICCGPGAAIQLQAGPYKGRIIIPFNALGGPKAWFNYLVYSDDLGASWHIAPGSSQYGSNESQVVQSGEDELLISARCHRRLGHEGDTPPAGWGPWQFVRNTRCRAFIRVKMSGEADFTWSPTELREDLPDPTCQGSIVRLSGYGVGSSDKSLLLLCNPANDLTITSDPSRGFAATPPARIKGMVRLSEDEGKTWVYAKRFFGDASTHFQYSVLTPMGGGKIGCLFESSPKIFFAAFDLEWLTSGEIK